MANDLATLNADLATALRDPTYLTWDTGELDDILRTAVARLYPRISLPLLPQTLTITLVSGTYFYALPSTVMAVSRIDRIDTSSNELGPINGSTWEIVGEPMLGTAKIHVAPVIADQGGTLRLASAYGRYDLVTNLMPDDYVPLVFSMARQEAYRRLGADRERFKQWLTRSQDQNVSINELVQLTNEARGEQDRLWGRYQTFQKPVAGRI